MSVGRFAEWFFWLKQQESDMETGLKQRTKKENTLCNNFVNFIKSFFFFVIVHVTRRKQKNEKQRKKK